jgi:pimeloyl-ACP methyl ester carboxylesterase
MDIVLIPGFWLTGDSWSQVAPTLEAAGHRVHSLTLPGKSAGELDHSGIGLSTHIAAVVERLDALAGEGATPVALVGHSGGAAIAWGAADARPEYIARLVFVDAIPLGDGSVVNDELPVDGDSVPLPPWEFFEDADLTGLDDDLRARFRAEAVPEPAGVARDQQRLTNDARFGIPATIIACEFGREMVDGPIASGVGWAREMASIEQLEVVELPTGHWPQLTRPVDLGESILAAVHAS